MIFKPFSNQPIKHAFFAPSKHTWLRWDKDRIVEALRNWKAAERGTILHEHAENCIRLKTKLKDDKSTLGMYVNDAIHYDMDPEVKLTYHPELCFGHADALSFRRKKLRIFDLKTGVVTPGSMEQLLIYAALFCLEREIDPLSIKYDLRIYQFDQATCHEPTGEEIAEIMDIIVENVAIAEMYSGEEYM